jgi:hypothetical protein
MIVTAVPANPDVGLKPLIPGVVLPELLTLTTTPALLAELFEVSVATAFRVCVPFGVFVVSQETA